MDKLDALRLLVDIAEAGSFAAAARRRAISTSSATLAIQNLESALGARLITRSTRKLVFTHEGERVLAGARGMLELWQAALTDIAQDELLRGPIRLAASNDFGRHSLRPLLDRFMARHPAVKVTLLLSDALENLLEQQIDVAIRSGPLPDSRLKARLLLRGRHLVCASPAYWRERGKPAHPAELAAHNCLVLARPGAPIAVWPFLAGGKRLSVRVDGDRAASDGDVLREWAAQGHGVILKNEWDMRAEIADGRLETALEDFVAERIDLYAVYPKDAPSRRAVALVDHLAQSLA